MGDAETKRLAHSEYWDERYAEVGPEKQVHEWFRTYHDLEPFFDRHLFQTQGPEIAPKILHLGSGDSTIPEDLWKRGYKNQQCIDFSSIIVGNMSKRHAQYEGITWKQGDVRQMDEIPPDSIDVAFDKGTLDAMIHGSPWDPPDDVLENTGRYIKEVHRVLKAGATFLYITYRQPHFIKPLLQRDGMLWDLVVETLSGASSSLDYHGFILKKVASNTVS